jgi:hypothetical protein
MVSGKLRILTLSIVWKKYSLTYSQGYYVLDELSQYEQR